MNEWINVTDDTMRLARILAPACPAFETQEAWANFLGDLNDFMVDVVCEAVGIESTAYKVAIGEIISRNLLQGDAE